MQSHWLCNSAGELFAEVPVQFPQLNSQVTQHCTFLLKTTAGKKSNITGLGEGGIALKSQQSLLLQNLIKGWRTLWLPLEHTDIRHERDSWYYLYHTPTSPPHTPKGGQKPAMRALLGSREGTGDQQVPFASSRSGTGSYSPSEVPYGHPVAPSPPFHPISNPRGTTHPQRVKPAGKTHQYISISTRWQPALLPGEQLAFSLFFFSSFLNGGGADQKGIPSNRVGFFFFF